MNLPLELAARVPKRKAAIPTRLVCGHRVAVVNIKVRGGTVWDEQLPLDFGFRQEAADAPLRPSLSDAGFTHQWITDNVSDRRLEASFWDVCRRGLELLQEFAREIYGPGAKVYTEGRCGGWAYVEGLPEVGSWDAIDFSKWQRFCRQAMWVVADVGYQMAFDLYANIYEPEVQAANLEVRMAESPGITA